MGHKGDIEHIYTTNKSRLPPQVIDDMREAYRKSQEFLQTKEPKRPDLLELPEDKFRQVVRERLLSTGTNSNGNQKVITMEEIETYIDEGWEFVTTLPNNKVVVGFSF
jgi:hypothetical protein